MMWELSLILLVVVIIMAWKVLERNAIDNAIDEFITKSQLNIGREVRCIMLTNKG